MTLNGDEWKKKQSCDSKIVVAVIDLPRLCHFSIIEPNTLILSSNFFHM